eukprot:9454629-Alexandrium_andersonii.AAC.1
MLGGGSRGASSHCSAARASRTAPACLQMGPCFKWSTHPQCRMTSAGAVPGGDLSSTSTPDDLPTAWVEATENAAAAWLERRTA